ncbi:MAG: hypothetical protein IKK03_00475 [Lachnospiraceae bacterium]|nr:hypothetical protein [Lachnospiraceae bacterium]
MENSSALENKYYRIVEELGEQQSFFFDEVQAVFPDMKKSSLYWNLSRLVDGGYLKRIIIFRGWIYCGNICCMFQNNIPLYCS